MKRFYQRAFKDIVENRYLTVVTVITISLSIMIVSAFALFFLNAAEVLDAWQKDIRMMVYLEANTSETARIDTQERLLAIDGVREAVFISKQDALEKLKIQMTGYSALLENLSNNPLPDAFELSLHPFARDSQALRLLAEHIRTLDNVDEVEYGQQWVQRFSGLIKLFSLAGYAIGGLFFMATVFIVANTIRLVLYSRRDEIEIMRLVGATDWFIKIPFYLVGMIQGGIGSLVGLVVLYGGYAFMTSHFQNSMAGALLTPRFFSAGTCAAIIAAGILIGWIGCLVCLKQFMRR